MILAHATDSTWHHKTSLPSRKQEAEPPLDACRGSGSRRERGQAALVVPAAAGQQEPPARGKGSVRFLGQISGFGRGDENGLNDFYFHP